MIKSIQLLLKGVPPYTHRSKDKDKEEEKKKIRNKRIEIRKRKRCFFISERDDWSLHVSFSPRKKNIYTDKNKKARPISIPSDPSVPISST